IGISVSFFIHTGMGLDNIEILLCMYSILFTTARVLSCENEQIVASEELMAQPLDRKQLLLTYPSSLQIDGIGSLFVDNGSKVDSRTMAPFQPPHWRID